MMSSWQGSLQNILNFGRQSVVRKRSVSGESGGSTLSTLSTLTTLSSSIKTVSERCCKSVEEEHDEILDTLAQEWILQ